MKKLVGLLLSLIVVICLLSVIPFNTLAENEIPENQDQEYIYYSDLFYGYSTYLTTNTYLAEYESDTSQIINAVLYEYIKTGHFTVSAIVQGVSIATDITALSKHTVGNNLAFFKTNVG